MASPVTGAASALQITRTFPASPQKVFEAWTDPQQLGRWSAPTAEYDVSAQVDLRVGGRYRIQMTHSSGAVHTALGEYREVQPPNKLVYTWGWEDGSVSDTLVTVEFRDRDGATELTLTHERFPDAEWRDKHNQGWSGCIARLESLLAE